jgi:hypothetical protein
MSTPDFIGEVASGERRPAAIAGVLASRLQFPEHRDSEIPWRSSVITISLQYRSVFGGIRRTVYYYEYALGIAPPRFPYEAIGTKISPQAIVTRLPQRTTGILVDAIEE